MEREQIKAANGDKYYASLVDGGEQLFWERLGDDGQWIGVAVVPVDVVFQTVKLLDADSSFKLSLDSVGDAASEALGKARSGFGSLLGKAAKAVSGDKEKKS